MVMKKKAPAFRVLLAAAALVAVLAPVPARAQALAGSMRSTDGRTIAVADMRGGASVLLFGGQLDPQSPDELPVLQRLADRYASRGVTVYWVSLDPDKTGANGGLSDADLAAYASRNGFRGTVLRDPSGAVFRTISTGGRRPQLPTIVVLDANGALAGTPKGGFDRDSDSVNAIAGILDKLVAR